MVFHFLLRQHIGAPSVPVVAVGDWVRRGQLIARKPDGMLGAALHSSVTGRVTSLTDTAVDITPDAGYETETGYLPLSDATPRGLVEASGLVGLGGAGFPTWGKLAPLPGGTVILNAAECEPILCHNIERLTREPAKTLRGLRIAMELTQAERGVVAIKAEHTEAIRALRTFLRGGIALCVLPSLYPAGEERAVVREALGVLTNVDELPSSAGAIVLNAETLYRLAEAVDDRKPLIDKDVTVAGKLSGAPVQV
ncbi:MAG: proline reductase-associated electron transfer protein PrdC, partial [Clostridia bacterium]|nr:proline reductase-associated electron transfer protein PrdC [Clostridia bacterium]